jgi:CDP-diacylglycerol---serine O-phosphatidyltransferase
MAGRNREPRDGELSIVQLLPNVLTITAIAAGLTAIRFGIDGRYETAVLLIMLAALIDGIDGRLARATNSDSLIGAEMDSLADFLNFGVAPVLVVFFWGLQDLPRAGWIGVLVYAICMVLRLARFNVQSKSSEEVDENHFVGVPAPAGALLVMLPMYVSFALADERILAPQLITLYMVVVGLLLISPLPTPSFKKLTVSRRNASYFLLGLALTGVAVLNFPWEILMALCLAYAGLVVRSLLKSFPNRDSKK